MRCSRCQNDNPADANYCIVCANRLEPAATTISSPAPIAPPVVPREAVVAVPVVPTPTPYPAPNYQIQTSPIPGMARGAALLGWLSIASIVAGVILVLLGMLLPSEVAAGFGFLVGIAAMLAAAVGGLLGIITIVRQQAAERATMQAALTGVASMGVFLVGCCIMLLLSSSLPGLE